jgi:uncharacterized protein YPO0396
MKKISKLKQNRYEYYKLQRGMAGVNGISAIDCAKLAVGQFPKKVTEAQKLLKSNKATIEMLRALAKKVTANRAQINRVIKVAKKISKSAYVYLGGDSVFVNITLRGLDGFKEGALPQALAALEKASGQEFSQSSDYPASGERDFASRGFFQIRVEAFLNDAPKQCRKVLVKTEMVEVPTYELQCV